MVVLREWDLDVLLIGPEVVLRLKPLALVPAGAICLQLQPLLSLRSVLFARIKQASASWSLALFCLFILSCRS